MKTLPYGYLLLTSGLYVVVYPEVFNFLTCDDGKASIAVDLLSEKGEYLDGMTTCPVCLPGALAYADKYW